VIANAGRYVAVKLALPNESLKTLGVEVDGFKMG